VAQQQHMRLAGPDRVFVAGEKKEVEKLGRWER
jgi:hypothetical protein